MPDSALEELLPFNKDLLQLLPNRNGKPIHISALYRWSTKGIRGIKLESVQVGRMRCTSRESLARFFALLAKEVGLSQSSEVGAGHGVRTPAARNKSHRLAEAGLEAARW